MMFFSVRMKREVGPELEDVVAMLETTGLFDPIGLGKGDWWPSLPVGPLLSASHCLLTRVR